MTRTNLLNAVGFAVLALIGAPCRAEAGASLPISAVGSASDVNLVVRAKLRCELVNGNVVCSKKKKTDKTKTPTAPAQEPAPQPTTAGTDCQLCTNKGDCYPAGPPNECEQRKAAAIKGTVVPFLTWSCVCK